MATVTHVGTLPDSANKADFYAIIDNATVTNIVNADISNSAGIVDTKLAAISTAAKVNISSLVATSQAVGDVIYYNGTSWARLGIGTAGQTLTVAGGLPSWA
jgi:hypothetical protein